jgi:hypothetical protein
MKWRETGGNYIMRSLITFVLAKQNYQVKDDEIGRACSTNGEKKNEYRILVGKPEGKDATRKTKT